HLEVTAARHLHSIKMCLIKFRAAPLALERRCFMKSIPRVLLAAALAFAATCANANSALAQGLCKGSFTLPHEVQWQSAPLPAGVYSFEMASPRFPTLLRLQGPHGFQFINALVADEKAGKQSKLVIEHFAGSDESVVTELYLAEAGLHFRYAGPKPH